MLKLLEALGIGPSKEFDADRADFIHRLKTLLARRGPQGQDLAYRLTIEENTKIVAAMIEQSLGENHLSLQVSDTVFVIVYPTLGAREARLTAARMRVMVEAALSGSSVRLEEASLDRDGALKVEPCADLATLVTQLIQATEASAQKEETPADTDRRDDPRTDLSGIKFVYRPMLTLQTKIVSTFTVVPIREVTSGRFESGYSVLDNPRDPGSILTLDQFTLKRSVAELKKLIADGGRSLFAVPVHFETLANPQRSVEYGRLCAEQSEAIQKRFVFEVVGLPGKVPQARLVQIVTPLLPVARAVIGRFPSDNFEFLEYRSSGLHAVGIDVYQTNKRERTLMTEMDRFVEMARKSRIKTYVSGVRSLSLLTAAISAGFDYISGHALGAALARAADVKTFQMDESYRRFLDAASPAPEATRNFETMPSL
jgi:hypothetical protein